MLKEGLHEKSGDHNQSDLRFFHCISILYFSSSSSGTLLSKSVRTIKTSQIA